MLIFKLFFFFTLSPQNARQMARGRRASVLTQKRVAAVRYEVRERRHRWLDCHGLRDVRRDLGGHYRTRVDGRVGGFCAERELQHSAVGLRDHGLGDDWRGGNGERRLREQLRRLLEKLLLREQRSVRKLWLL